MSNRAHTPRRLPVPARRMAGLAGLAGAGLVLIPFLATPSFAASGFTPNELVVFQAGATSTTALSATAVADYLEEYPTAGAAAPDYTDMLPTVSSGSATSEGEISLSSDGSHVLATGYNAAAGTASVASTTASADPRVVDSVAASGAIDSTTSYAGAYSGNNIRSAASPDGTTAIYSTGAATPGVGYSAKGGTTATGIAPGTNYRQAAIYFGQLYASSSSSTGPVGIDAIGSGLPTSGTTDTTLAGLDTSGSPYSFVLLNEAGGSGPDTAYVADSAVGVEKYKLTGGTWVQEGSVAEVGVTGLVANDNAGVVSLYFSTPTTIYGLVDSTGQSGTVTGTPATLATAPTNTAFRGLAFSPGTTDSLTGGVTAPPASVPESPLTIGLPAAFAVLAGGAVALNRRRRSNRV